MDFFVNQADQEVQRILIIVGAVFALFAVYFVLAVLSNRSVRRLADTLRRPRGEKLREVEIKPAPSLLSAPWAIIMLLAAAGCLIVLLVFSTSALR